MNANSNPQAAAEQARKIYRAVTTKFGHLLGLDVTIDLNVIGERRPTAPRPHGSRCSRQP
jgi:hypothetical protein